MLEGAAAAALDAGPDEADEPDEPDEPDAEDCVLPEHDPDGGP